MRHPHTPARSLAGALAAALLATLGAEALAPHAAEACAVVSPGDEFRIAIQREEAVIVWDEVRKVEHFIRRAEFASDAKDFGFLVPTPTPPTLAEEKAALFEDLDRYVRTHVEPRYEIQPQNLALGLFLFTPVLLEARSAAGAAAGVRVLEERSVAGFRAAVLEADRADALAAWLKENGYPSRPALEKWLEIYVAMKWTITAFKFERDAAAAASGAPTLTTRAVRLSFATHAPFYPYYEPDDAQALPGRALRVHLVGPGRMAGDLSRRAVREGEIVVRGWHAATDHAAPFDATSVAPSLAALGPSGPTASARWLTTLIDRARVRSPADVFFAPDPEGPERKLVRTREVEVPPFLVPFDVIAIGAFVMWRRRRKALKTRAL